jgi:hypothetical protein
MADVVVVRGDTAEAARTNPRVRDASAVAPADVIGHRAFDLETGDAEVWLAEPGGVFAFRVERQREIPLAALDRFLDYLVTLQGPHLIRLRGAVPISPEDTVIVEGIGGLVYPPMILDRPPGAMRFTVVAIGLEQPMFEGYLDAFLNEARVDTPDREALTANPLAIAGFSARSGR